MNILGRIANRIEGSRRPRRRLLFLAALVSSALVAPPVRANGAFPAAQSVFFPTRRPDTMIVAANFGILESNDGGRSWLYACEDPKRAADARLYTLVQDGDRERMFTLALQGLAVTEDGGCSLEATAGSTDLVTVNDYFVDPSSAKRVFALARVLDPGTGAESSAVLVSEDGGRTFGPPLRSEPAGHPDSLDFESVEISATDSRIVYLVSSSITRGRQFERSSDGGLTWETTPLSASAGSRFGIITVDPVNLDKVFVRGTNFSSDALLVTRDGGKNFDTVLDLAAQMAVMTAFVLRKDGTILIALVDIAGVTSGLRSTDGGLTFQPWDSGGQRLMGLAEHEGRLYALAEPFALSRSDASGETWEPLLTFSNIQGVKPCAQSRCATDCLRLADLGVLMGGSCGITPPLPGDGSRADTAKDGKPVPGDGAGCGCRLPDDGPPDARRLLLAVLLGALWRGRRASRRFGTGRILCVVALTTTAVGCRAPAPAAGQDAGRDTGAMTITSWSLPGYEQVSLGIPVDLDPGPQRLEIVLTARPAAIPVRATGAPVPMWTYDGWLPGPLIRGQRGDTLVVHFRNHLDVPSTIHWHGVRVPNPMDGTHDTQTPVPPGGEFVYSFPLVDAGAFWYHPHHVSNQQVGMGLYGPLVVRAADEPAGLGEPAVLVLSDLRLDASGNVIPYHHGGIDEGKQGREGAVLLVNGRQNPTLSLAAARRHRWLLINGSPNRFFRVAVAGHPLTRIGGDGGLLEKPLPESSDLLLVPGERADVVFVATGNPGDRISVDVLPYDRGAGEGASMHLLDLNLVAQADPGGAVVPLPDSLRTIERLKLAPDTVIDQLTIGERDNGFVINDGQTFALGARVGDLRLYDIINHTVYDHPFHLHGFFFQVVDPVTSAPREPVEWKDTYNVRALSVSRFAVRYDDRPGPWMIHCHILDHAEIGVSATIDLKR